LGTDGGAIQRLQRARCSAKPAAQGVTTERTETGAGINGKMIALIIVILLDVAFMVWLVYKGKLKRWPKLIKPTIAIQLPALE